MKLWSKKLSIVILSFLAIAVSAQIVYSENLAIEELRCFESDGIPRTINKKDFACQIGDQVRAKITGYSEWIETFEETDREAALGKLLLTVDGQTLTGLSPRLYTEDGAMFVHFDIVATGDNRDDWRVVLGRSNPYKGRTINLSVNEQGTVNYFGSTRVNLHAASGMRWILLTLFWVLIIVLFGILVCKGRLLRESGPPLPPGQFRPFSLARTQMAFWFLTILTGFIFLWVMTGATDTLTAGVLGLAGISAATGLTAVAIGNSKASLAGVEVDDLENQLEKLKAAQKDFKAQVAALTSPMNENQKLEGQKFITDINRVKSEISWINTDKDLSGLKRFFRDIFLSEGQVTFSRFQIVAWTMLLGIVFAHSVFSNLRMPEFGENLLALMAISGGTYIGFKFPGTPQG